MTYEYGEEYVLMHFDDPFDESYIVNREHFFHMIDADTPRPLVQFGRNVFYGTYDQSILGTSLLFEEDPNPPPQDIFERETNISLKFAAKTTKFLALRKCNVLDDSQPLNKDDWVELDFPYSYATVLRQVADGTLNINDAIKRPKSPTPVQTQIVIERNEEPEPVSDPTLKVEEEEPVVMIVKPEIPTSMQEEAAENEPPEEEISTFTKLQRIAHPPIRDPQYYDLLTEDAIYSDRDFSIIKGLFVNSLNTQKVVSDLESEWYRHIDLIASIEQGIIEEKPDYDDDDAEKLLCWENFDNFSLELKVIVLRDYLEEERAVLNQLSHEEVTTPDENGRTRQKCYRMLKTLYKDMKYVLVCDKLQTKSVFSFSENLRRQARDVIIE